MSNDELVTRYNNIKRKQQDFENQKIQVETSINIKKTELEAVKTRLQELGVTDFDNLDTFIQAKREQFDKTLQELEARLNGSV